MTSNANTPRPISLLWTLTLLVVMAGTVVSMLTSLAWWMGHGMHGNRLLLHMMASGLLVVGLPAYAILLVLRSGCCGTATLDRGASLRWAAVLLGTLMIATMFLCMLPLLATPEQAFMIQMHGWLGWSFAVTFFLSVLRRKGV
ncbi:MAG: hypothetical protein AAGD07_24885 [Planctomycetota bacterium]